jgi:hypothetical protein
MTLTGENRSAGRKTCPSATSFTINPTRTCLKFTVGLQWEKPATDSLSCCTRVSLENKTVVSYMELVRGRMRV